MCCNEFVFINIIKILKKYTLTPISDEILLNNSLSFVITKYNLLNKLGNKIYFDKEQTSRLMSRKINFPDGLPNLIYADDIEDVVKKGLEEFVKDYINKNYINSIIKDIKNLYHNDIFISEETCISLDSYSNDFISFLSNVYLESLKYENKKHKIVKNIWSHGQSEINICYDDIIEEAFNNTKEEKIIVIPVDTSFDTMISKPEDVEQHISEDSLHGKWIKRIKALNKIQLEDYINQEIIKRGYKKDSVNNYPLGSILVIKLNNTYFYLFAISQYNENRKTLTNKEQLINSLINLIEFYDINGQGYPLYIPLIGTGRSRANLNHSESLNIIKKTLRENTKIINGSINIVVYYNDMNKLERRDLNEL